MARLLAIDYGLKRTGLAVSDPLKIIASALDTVETEKLFNFLQDYILREPVELFIVGMPRRLNNQPSEMAQVITGFILKLKAAFICIYFSFSTSPLSQRVIVKSLWAILAQERRSLNKNGTVVLL